MIITQITSNTAAVAIMVPITISTFQGVSMNPVPFVYIVAVAANCGLMLPSSAGGPAVAAGYGVNLKTMFARGFWLTVLLWSVIVMLGYFLATYWRGFRDRLTRSVAVGVASMNQRQFLFPRKDRAKPVCEIARVFGFVDMTWWGLERLVRFQA